MKNFKFYIGAFLTILSIETFFNIIISMLISIPICVASGNNYFWVSFIAIEIVAVIEALRLTFTIKKDPWGKE
jgi:hypothetical protein